MKPQIFSIVSDGTYYYIYDGISSLIYKIGSGNAGCLPGEIILTSKTLTDIIPGLSVPENNESEKKLDETEQAIPELQVFSSSKKSEVVGLNDTQLVATCQVSDLERYCSVMIDYEFDTHSDTVANELMGYCYFEITVRGLNDSNINIIGLGFADNEFSLDDDQMLGWNEGSYAYHSDDGSLHGLDQIERDDEDEDEDEEWPAWNSGDVIGCGIDYRSHTIFYTRNGKFLGNAFDFTDDTPQFLYPTVTLQGENVSVELNTGQTSFRYTGEQVLGSLCGKPGASKTSKTSSANKYVCASMAIVDRSIYMHFGSVLNPNHIAIINTETLEFENILDLKPIVDKHHEESTDVQSSSEEFIFTISESKPTICLRATAGYTLEVVGARLDGSTDVTLQTKDQVNEAANSLFIENALDLFGFSAASNTSANSPSRTLTVQIISTKKAEQKLSLPITASGKKLYLVEESIESTSNTSKLYNPIELVEFQQMTSKLADLELSQKLEEVKQMWINYLKDLHHSGKEANSAAKMEQDWKTLFPRVSTENEGNAEAGENLNNGQENQLDEVQVEFNIDKSSQTLLWTKCIPWMGVITEVEDQLDHKNTVFRLIVLDVNETIEINKVIPLSFAGYEHIRSEQWSSSSALCNGYQYYVMCPMVESGSDNQKTRCKGWKFSLKTGEVEKFDSKTFSKSRCGLPTSFALDQQNNLIVGFDSLSSKVLNWRNPGLSPTLHQVDKDSLSASDRILRLMDDNTLLTSSYELQVNFILSILDKLSEPYGGNVLSQSNDADGLNQIKLFSKVPSESGESERCSITIKECAIPFDDDDHDSNSGFHIAILNANTFAVEKTRWFESEAEDSSNRMADFLNDLPFGTVLLIVNAKSLHVNVGRYAYDALMDYGCCDLEAEEKCNSLIMIGKKGLKPSQADYLLGKTGETLQLSRLLPPTTVALRVEPEVHTIVQLIHLARDLLQVIEKEGPCGSNMNHTNFIAALNLVQVNLYSFTSRTSSESSIKAFGQDTKNIQSFLQLLMSSTLMENAAVRTGGVALFMASLNIVYPKLSDQVELLKSYVTKHIEGSLQLAESYLLEVLMRKFLKIQDFFVVDKNGKIDCTQAMAMIDLCELIIRKENATQFGPDQSNPLRAVSVIFDNAVNLMLSLSKMLLAVFCEPMLKPNTNGGSSGSSVAIIPVFKIITVSSQLSSELMKMILGWKQKNDGSVLSSTDLLAYLQKSPIGMILPITTMIFTEIIRSGGYKFISQSMELVLGVIHDLDECLSLSNNLLQILPPEASMYNDSIPQRHSSTRVFESEHPYRSNMDERIPMSFPGATSVTISFDIRSRTENSCDYLIFQNKNGESLHPIIEKFTGRDGSENWPGCGGRPPLTLEANDFILFFHSDGSVEDWGYKFTLTANYPIKLSAQNRSNWIVKLSFELVQALSILGSAMIQGPSWNEELEGKLSTWMENPLIKPELFDLSAAPATEQDKFLLELVDRPSKSLSELFVRKMKAIVLEDQGNVEYINKAVYATCATIIKANNLTMEAFAFANGHRDQASSALIKAWKSGQKMRSYFELNDVRESMNANGNAKSKGQKSLYAGAEEEVVKAAAEAVMSRAKFLLRSAKGEEGNASNDAEAIDIMKSLQKVASPFTVPKEASSPLGGDATPTGKWQLASKAVKLQRQMSQDTRNVAAMWHSLVDEALVIEKLKSVFLKRRKFGEKSSNSKESSVTEKILNFVQSDVDIVKLHEVNGIRNKRAIVRSKGFDVFAHIIHDHASPFAIFISISSFVSALNKTKREEGSGAGVLHYANSVEGCSPNQHNLLWQKYTTFFNNCVSTVKRGLERFRSGETQDFYLWQKAISNALRACALDFELSDHQTILDSGIVSILDLILRQKSRDATIAIARALTEIIVSRFIVFDTNPENSTSSHSNLSKKLIELLVSLLSENTSEVIEDGGELESSSVTKVLTSIPGHMAIQNFASGVTLKNVDLSFAHSISFWIRRGASSLIDNKILDFPDLVGKSVIRGFDFPTDTNKSDGGYGSLGKIIEATESSKEVKVKWGRGRVVTYKFDYVSKLEVVVADPSLGGYIFSKGSAELMEEQDKKRKFPKITHSSAQLLPDGTILVVYHFSNNEQLMLRSKKAINAEDWTHVSIVFDRNYSLKLLLNGHVICQEQCDVKSFVNINIMESNHPVDESDFKSKSFTVDNSIASVLWMQEESKLSNSMRLVINSGDIHDVCDQTSAPGLGGNPTMLIHSNKFEHGLEGDMPTEEQVSFIYFQCSFSIAN